MVLIWCLTDQVAKEQKLRVSRGSQLVVKGHTMEVRAYGRDRTLDFWLE